MPAPAFHIRPRQPTDALADLTTLLHAAYTPLAEAGLDFTAAHQTEALTAERLAGGKTCSDETWAAPAWRPAATIGAYRRNPPEPVRP